jgi:hypothetical protein
VQRNILTNGCSTSCPVEPVVRRGDPSAIQAIGRANVDGSNATQGFITGFSAPNDVEVDANYVYWSTLLGNTIGRANLNGTGANESFIPLAQNADDVEVDANHVYWAQNAFPPADTIGRADLDGLNVNPTFITTFDFGGDMALDSNYIYWTNRGTGSATIGRAQLDGSNVDNNFISPGAPPSGQPRRNRHQRDLGRHHGRHGGSGGRRGLKRTTVLLRTREKEGPLRRAFSAQRCVSSARPPPARAPRSAGSSRTL